MQADASLSTAAVELIVNLACSFDLTHATSFELELSKQRVEGAVTPPPSRSPLAFLAVRELQQGRGHLWS